MFLPCFWQVLEQFLADVADESESKPAEVEDVDLPEDSNVAIGAAMTVQATFRGRKTRQIDRQRVHVVRVIAETEADWLAKQGEREAAAAALAEEERRRVAEIIAHTESVRDEQNFVKATRAAIPIQAAMRRHAAKRVVGGLRVERETAAATTIQAGIRGDKTRQQMDEILSGIETERQERQQVKTDAATRIQAVVRSRAAKRLVEVVIATRAATRIQSRMRARAAHRAIREVRAERNGVEVSMDHRRHFITEERAELAAQTIEKSLAAKRWAGAIDALVDARKHHAGLAKIASQLVQAPVSSQVAQLSEDSEDEPDTVFEESVHAQFHQNFISRDDSDTFNTHADAQRLIRLQQMAAAAFQGKGMDGGDVSPSTAHNDTYKILKKVQAKWVKPQHRAVGT